MKKTATQNTELSYLSRLQFDPKLATGWVAHYVGNIRFVMLLILTIVLLGSVSYFTLPRRLNPEIKIPIVIISAVLPGANPSDVETLLTKPIEDKVTGLTGVQELTSVSRENVSVITMQFASGITQEKARNDVQTAVDEVTNLPEDATTPKVRALDFEDQPVWTFTLTTQNEDTASLMRTAENLQKKLEETTQIDRVTLTGFETQEVIVSLKPEAVLQYGINPAQLAATVKAALPSYPAGTVTTGAYDFALTVDATVDSLRSLRELRVTLQNETVQLGDIATIQERSQVGNRPLWYANHETEPVRAITLSVYKTSTTNIDDAVEAAKPITEAVLAPHKDTIQLQTIENTAEQITKQFDELIGEFQTTILLVFTCLFIFLGLRQAIIACLTIPLTFLSAFFFMDQVGMSINFLSMFAFLLALGLLVDDSIVVVSAMTAYFRTGKFTPYQTSLLVWRDTIVPIWSTTLTTIWSFVPLLLASGIIGEFIKPIPVVVAAVMISSTAIAVLITLPLMSVILKPEIAPRVVQLLRLVVALSVLGLIISTFKTSLLFPVILVLFAVTALLAWRWQTVLTKFAKKQYARLPILQKSWAKIVKFSDHGVVNLENIGETYGRLIRRILVSRGARRQVIFAILLYAVVSFALLPLGLVKSEFFPKTDSEQLYIGVELPSGTPIEVSEQAARELLNQVRTLKELEFATASIATTPPSDMGGSAGNNNFLITLRLPEKEHRSKSSIEIATELRETFKDYSTGKLSVVEQSGGPPAGADVQITLLGEELSTLDTLATEVQQYLESQPSVTNVQKSIPAGTSAVVFVPNQDALNQHGLNSQSLGLWLRTAGSGFTLDKTTFGGDRKNEIDIVFRMFADRPNLQELSSLQIPTQKGNVPLSALGSFEARPNPVFITREKGKRSIAISAAIKPGFAAADANAQLLEHVEKNMKLPTGYSWKTGGANEENEKSVQSILQAMVVAFILILVTMVIQFNSYRKAVLVIAVIPLAVSSVFFLFALTGTPLSFPAIIGILSLFGIVVTNSMFIVDKINMNLNEDMEFIDALADAGATRLEPIVLTKLSTVLGLLPITLADPLWRGLGGAIISGLLIASTIMLLFIPVMYFMWFAPAELRKKYS